MRRGLGPGLGLGPGTGISESSDFSLGAWAPRNSSQTGFGAEGHLPKKLQSVIKLTGGRKIVIKRYQKVDND